MTASFIEGKKIGTISDANVTNLVDTPPSGTRRIVKTITIANNDGVPNIVTISVISGTTSILWQGQLDGGDTWCFGDGGEIIVVDSNTSVVIQLSGVPSTPLSFMSAYGDATT